MPDINEVGAQTVTGGGNMPNEMGEVRICCSSMLEAFIDGAINFDTDLLIYLAEDESEIDYCPYCGKDVILSITV